MEMKVNVSSPCGNLEGLIYTGAANKGVVITHPHPQYGGDMHNPVVEAIASAYQKEGFTTLRFNFRGTGSSTGNHDQGVGEQEDVKAAISLLRNKGMSSTHLSGYSFGAWVNSMAIGSGLAVDGMTMVAPPAAFIDFKEGVHLPMLSAVVAGSRDEFAPPNRIHPLMSHWNPDASLDIIDGADHFFFGFLDEVTRLLVQGLRRIG